MNFTVPAWAWITWLAVTAGSFAILETLALATTLILFVAWFLPHILTNWL